MTREALTAILDQSWMLLAAGAASRKSPMHTPVIATIGSDGVPSQRVMVLREADQDRRLLRFHTDSRTPKVDDLVRRPEASVIAYDPDAAVQLRLSGSARVDLEGRDVEAAWQQSTLFARRCYMATGAPGSPVDGPTSGLPTWIEGKMPDEDQIGPARENFAVLKIEVRSIDWLHLANSGHRRARFDHGVSGWSGRWLIP